MAGATLSEWCLAMAANGGDIFSPAAFSTVRVASLKLV